ncbi:DUF72 domain-containing protein [Flavipsychrobacter stenotrophus]|uniref:DUF72 domain-containing protein n=1 Tax=Flavipsychrobacter stenotrophus TaxID=2077091 RepID=A0A2S7SSF1_9BACT|nr:DUF72 domain-containing protein [Flavipsychrobacter stenotrophus]PQJ09830.1 DUF72 domain-containing protein [Flavipsychrobacter stenotrophus]
MDFGKVPDNELDHIDFTLPPDPETNRNILKKGKGNTKFYIGCPKWGIKEWVGKLYPKGTKEKDFLAQYATQFNSIEFNGFYYNVHSREQVEKWVRTVPENFLFCPKFTQSITHFRRLKDARHEVDAFLNVVEAFGRHLGPVFLMPHPQMGLSHRDAIEDFIADLPQDIDVFLELRHEDWYDHDGGYDKELYSFMVKQKKGLIITDASGRRDCVHMHLSTPECFIRFVGNGLHPTDYTRIDAWVQRIKQWMDQGLETCYFFMHQHEELHSPELIRYFIQELNKHAGTKIPLPRIYDEGAATLF